jgi:hypothetical protein
MVAVGLTPQVQVTLVLLVVRVAVVITQEVLALQVARVLLQYISLVLELAEQVLLLTEQQAKVVLVLEQAAVVADTTLLARLAVMEFLVVVVALALAVT